MVCLTVGRGLSAWRGCLDRLHFFTCARTWSFLESDKIVLKAMGRSGLYTKIHRRSMAIEQSMKNQNERIAPEDRT
jgi:hypothetical protein